MGTQGNRLCCRMGQAKANLIRIFRATDPVCIYCGIVPSVDGDRAPLNFTFRGKDRPKGASIRNL